MITPAKTLGYKTVTPGPMRTCPVCGVGLANSEMGANSHLRMHIRRGEIAREDEQRLRLALLHRPYRSNAELSVGESASHKLK